MQHARADRAQALAFPGFRFVLRDATDMIHQRMHRHPGYAQVADGTINRADYRRLLARALGFYAPVEPLAGLDGMATARLTDDLITLGVRGETIAALPRCAPPEIGTEIADRLGAAYVLRGAALGGQVMARALPRTLPARFLSGDGIEGPRWRTFIQTLESTCLTTAQRAGATRAAILTFTAFEQWMDGWGDADAE